MATMNIVRSNGKQVGLAKDYQVVPEEARLATVAGAAPTKNPKQPRQTRKKKEVFKLCPRCNRKLPLGDFYKNAQWAAQAYCDAWCKSCAQKFSVNKETLREYCWYNNRAWNEGHWERSVQKGRYSLTTNNGYLKADDVKKARMEEAAACRVYLVQMNLSNVYSYSENIIPEEGLFPEFDAERTSRELALEKESQRVEIEAATTYDVTWGGVFASHELEYLNAYYAELEKDFALDDVNMRDYGRKVSRASLLETQMYEAYKRGKIKYDEYKAARDNFDALSKSANFAACRRKDSEAAKTLPMGFVTEYLEANGKIMADQEDWDKDRIDMLIDEMYHIAEALGLEVVGSEKP